MKLAGSVFLGLCVASVFGQTKIYRQLPSDNSIGFGLSDKFNVEVRTCSESYQSVYTYGITPNDNQVTKKEHLAMFGFNPVDGPAIIRVTLKNGTALSESNCILMNKTYKGVTSSYSNGALLIQVCQPMKQLMVRLTADKANPLMIHVDPYDDPEIAAGANVVTFDGGVNGKIHEQIAQYDRYSVPNDVDVVVIEDGALFKGTIHTSNGRSKPLTIQGKGMIICRYTSKPADNVKMEYNAMELGDGSGHNIYGVTMVNGRHFAIRVGANAHIQNLKIYGYRNNNDGIVTNNNSIIENCFFKCNDDHIKLYYDSKVTVRNCVFYEQTNGALFQMAWNKINPADNSLVENIEVLEWEAGCGDPDLGQGGIARSFINHRESEENGKMCTNVTFRNVYIQPQIARFVCLNGLDHGITYTNLTLENFTLEKAPKDISWLYANPGDDNSTSIEINFKNVRFGDRFIQQSDFKTKGTVNLSFDDAGDKYLGFMNPNEASSCASCPTDFIYATSDEGTGVRVYPIPAKSRLFIELDELATNASMQIFDVSGKLITKEPIKNKVTEMNIEGFRKSIYFIKIYNGTENYCREVVIE